MANVVRFGTGNDGKLRKRIQWTTPGRYLRDRPIPTTRYSTGLPSFDAAFRGGLWPNLLLVVQGAPNAGKSSFAAQLAAHHVQHGAKVYVYAPDEGTRAVCVRLGQYAGIDRDSLEFGEETALQALETAYPNRVRLVDADDPTALLETFLDQIVEEHGPDDPAPLFLVDSVQVVRTDLDDTFEAPRHRIAYAMAQILSTCIALPMISVCVSHVARPAFAAKDSENRIDPMAAAAEGAIITRAAHAMIHLDGELEDSVTGWLRKNRNGSRPKIRFKYDFPKGHFYELDPLSASDEKALAKTALDTKRQADHEKAVSDLQSDMIRRLTKAAPDRLTFSQLRQLVGGRLDNFREAIAGLEAQQAIDWIPGPRKATLWGLRKEAK